MTPFGAPARLPQLLIPALSLVALALSACGSPLAPPGVGGPPPERHTHHAVVGALSEHIQGLQADDDAEDCDHRHADIQKTLAAALDFREKEIEAFLKNQPPSKRFRRISMGPTFVRESLIKPEPELGWQNYTQSWKDAYEDYLKIKDQPVNMAWSNLNMDVRSLVSDDEDRVAGVNYFLDKDSGPAISTALGIVRTCFADKSCTRPKFDQATLEFVLGVPAYRWYWDRLSQQKWSDDRKKTLKSFLDWLDSDRQTYAFRVNPSVKKSPSKQVLSLPLLAGPFEGAESQLAGYIEEVWVKSGFQVKIDWKPTGDLAQIFKFLLGASAGERPYVQFNKRAIMLFPDVRVRSIAHEIGHVLGFPDHYYTIWRPEFCDYLVQNREDDIMSDSTSGSVTAEEWSDLQKFY